MAKFDYKLTKNIQEQENISPQWLLLLFILNYNMLGEFHNTEFKRII